MTAAWPAERPQTRRPLSLPKRGAQGFAIGHLHPMVLVYLVCVVLSVGFYAGPLLMTTLRLLLLAMVLPLMVQLIMGKFGRLRASDFLFFGHVIWMTAALWVNNPAQVVQQSGSVGVEFIGGYLMGRAYVRSRADFLGLCQALVLLVLASVPFALLETVTGDPLLISLIRKLPGIRTVEILSIEKRMGLERVQSTFAHPIHYGLFCSVAFSLCFIALQDVYSTKRRFLTCAIVAFAGFLALSSGALLAIVLQVALIGWSLIFARIPWRWWLLVGLFALAYLAIDLLSNRSPLRVFMSYATFSAHNAYWRGIIFEWGIMNVFGSAVEQIPANVLFGIGLNDWVRPWYMYSGSMDNFWLVLTVRYGVPGAALLIGGWAAMILAMMRRDLSGDAQLTRFRRAWVFTFLGLSFTLCTVHVWTNIYSFIFFMFGAGLWMLEAPLNTGSAAKSGSDKAESGENSPRGGHVYSRFPPRPTPSNPGTHV